jgi:hypothetical protein
MDKVEKCELCKKEKSIGIKRIWNGWIKIGKKCSKKLGLKLSK